MGVLRRIPRVLRMGIGIIVVAAIALGVLVGSSKPGPAPAGRIPKIDLRPTKNPVLHIKTTDTSGASTASTPITSQPSCQGETPAAKPDGSAWTCTFDDEFDATTGDGAALDTNIWVPQNTAQSGFTTGDTGSQVCYRNSPDNISVSGGVLNLTVRKETAPYDCGWYQADFTGGMVSSYTNFNQTYGRFEVRAKLPQTSAKGLQETLWLWPVDDNKYGSWPGSGEIDFAEFYSDYSNLVVPYIHYNYDASTQNAGTNTNVVTNYCPITLSQFNDYAVVWEPGKITISVNGTTCMTDNYVPNGSLTAPQPFDQPFFVLLTQALGFGANAYDPASTPLPATTSVDYVRVWK